MASTTYGYDLDDNLTSKQTTGTAGAGTNAYDYANRMTSWTKDGTATTAYEWDAAGNRTCRIWRDLETEPFPTWLTSSSIALAYARTAGRSAAAGGV